MLKKILEPLKQFNRYRNDKIRVIKNFIFSIYIEKIRKKTKLTPNKYKEVAIIMTDLGIGDGVVFTFLIKSLQDQGIKVTVIAESRILFLFDDLIKVDRVIKFENIKKLKKQVKNLNIDLVIDMFDINPLIEKRINIIYALKPKHTIGFNQTSNIFDTSIIYEEFNTHVTTRIARLLDLLQINYDKVKYHIEIPNNALNEVKTFIKNHDLTNKKIVVFNPFGSFDAKSFSYDQIESISEFLSKYDVVTIITGENKKLININTQHNNVIKGTFSSFESVVALISLCDLLISVDTSVVHVANTFNTPLISIYTNMVIGKFNSNFVWAPNYANAKQIFTKDHNHTSDGDEISKMELHELLNEIQNTIETDILKNRF
ncbi:glycosyltransferase family 9 protein [Orbaceae bacterium ac157xtp]